MYTTKILKEGIEFLGITDREIIQSIFKSNYENRFWLLEQEIKKQNKELYNNRFNIPKGLKKKEYTALLKQTQNKIDEYKDIVRKDPDRVMSQLELEDYIEKKKKIKKILELHTKFGTKNNEMNIEKAKQYPIDQLLEFKGGFTRCIYHEEKTGSMKYYKDKNRVHCFSCNQGWDAIDIYQKLHNVEFIEAVKRLSN